MWWSISRRGKDCYGPVVIGVILVVTLPIVGESNKINLTKYPLSRQLYLAVFFTCVSCLTPKYGAHNRKMSLEKWPTRPKKDKMRISGDSVSNILWRSKHEKYLGFWLPKYSVEKTFTLVVATEHLFNELCSQLC